MLPTHPILHEIRDHHTGTAHRRLGLDATHVVEFGLDLVGFLETQAQQVG